MCVCVLPDWCLGCDGIKAVFLGGCHGTKSDPCQQPRVSRKGSGSEVEGSPGSGVQGLGVKGSRNLGAEGLV